MPLSSSAWLQQHDEMQTAQGVFSFGSNLLQPKTQIHGRHRADADCSMCTLVFSRSIHINLPGRRPQAFVQCRAGEKNIKFASAQG